jgi:broad specificity phosphatase PhoE
MPPPTIYYFRHGLTDWNVAGRLQGQIDVPLNSVGCGQAVRCGEILRKLFARAQRTAGDFDYVSSPLVRARASMGIVRRTLALPVDGYVLDDRLAEISFGEWEGLTYADVIARDRAVVETREGDKWHFLPPGGESYQQLAIRVRAWYSAIGRDTVVCAHGGTGRALVAVLGVAPEEEAAHHPIDQGMVYVFSGDRLTRHH